MSNRNKINFKEGIVYEEMDSDDHKGLYHQINSKNYEEYEEFSIEMLYDFIDSMKKIASITPFRG